MQPDPILLAFDTSAAHCAAAVVQGDTCLIVSVVPMTKGQAENLFPILENVLSTAGLSWPDLTGLAVCTGPGNFTGVRISVSAARGLALSLNIPAIGVSRLAAMAYGATAPCTALLDARQNRVYCQEFMNGHPNSDITQSPAETFQGQQNLLLAEDIPNLTGKILPQEDIIANLARCALPLLNSEQPRPAPIYIRAPDAALPSDPPPVILP